MQPVGRQQGWQLVSCATSAFVQAPSEANGEVEFGALLGAGSYGRWVLHCCHRSDIGILATSAIQC